jgi:hypothetical protein
MQNKIVLGAIAAVIIVIAALHWGLATPTIGLPSNAAKLSDCIPNMGAHYANPKDMPFGPIYLVDNGKIVGIEYMMSKDEMEESISTIAGMKVGKTFTMQTMGAKFDHAEINYLPEGHEGDTSQHFDMHMYLVSPQEQQKLCQ